MSKIIAIAYFTGSVAGTVKFIEEDDKVEIQIKLKGLIPNALHGFHVHEYGDISEGCQGTCAHFNPYKKSHGGPTSKHRHVGDLGNLKTNKKGNVNSIYSDNIIKLHGTANIVGRGLVIHEDEDDLGLGGHPESLTTGNSGKRIACATIVYTKK